LKPESDGREFKDLKARSTADSNGGRSIVTVFPYSLDIDPIILMAEPISNPTNLALRQPRAQRFSPLTQPHRRVADDLEFAFDGGETF
jgi:hypothetical protein